MLQTRQTDTYLVHTILAQITDPSKHSNQLPVHFEIYILRKKRKISVIREFERAKIMIK